MPITLTPLITPPLVGPGLGAQVQSDIVGPYPTGTNWQFTVFPPAPSESVALQQSVPAQPGALQFVWGDTGTYGDSTILNQSITEGATSHIDVQLQEPTGTLDQGTFDIPWSNTAGLYRFISHLQGQAGQGGFTDSDRAQLNLTTQNTTTMDTNWQQYEQVTLPSLQDVLNGITQGITATIGGLPNQVSQTIGQLMSWRPWDFLADRDLSGGTTCDRVDYDASYNALYGVTLTIDVIPDGWPFATPDKGWSFHDLAVLCFWRAGGLVQRHGVHTMTFSVSPIPDSLTPTVIELPVSLQPGQYHITVDWAPGVCGHLVGHVLP